MLRWGWRRRKKKRSPSSHIQSSVGNTGCGSCAYLYQATPSTCRWSYNCIKKPIFKSPTIDRKTKNKSRAFLLSCIKHLWVLARNSFCDSSTGTVREALHCVFDGDDADEETEGRRETDSRRKRFGGGGFRRCIWSNREKVCRFSQIKLDLEKSVFCCHKKGKCEWGASDTQHIGNWKLKFTYKKKYTQNAWGNDMYMHCHGWMIIWKGWRENNEAEWTEQKGQILDNSFTNWHSTWCCPAYGRCV